MSYSPQRINPFPGLRAFTQDEDFLFFGREEQTLELLQRLGDHRFVAVVGTSGSGKSSLVRCGLLSELLGGRMLAAGAAWEIAVTQPGREPPGAVERSARGRRPLRSRGRKYPRESWPRSTAVTSVWSRQSSKRDLVPTRTSSWSSISSRRSSAFTRQARPSRKGPASL